MQWSERNIFERGSAAAGRPGVTSKLTAVLSIATHRMNHEAGETDRPSFRLFAAVVRCGFRWAVGMRGWRLSTGLRRLEGVPDRAGRLRSREATCAYTYQRLGSARVGSACLRASTNHESRITNDCLCWVLRDAYMYVLLCASEQLQLVAVHVNTSSWTIASVFWHSGLSGLTDPTAGLLIDLHNGEAAQVLIQPRERRSGSALGKALEWPAQPHQNLGEPLLLPARCSVTYISSLLRFCWQLLICCLTY